MDKKHLLPWQEAYIDYLSDPTDERSVDKFCHDNVISRVTIDTWRRKNKEYIEIEVEHRTKEYDFLIRSRAKKDMYKRMSKSDIAVRTALQLLGDLVEKTEVKSTPLNPEEKRERVKKLLDGIVGKLESSES